MFKKLSIFFFLLLIQTSVFAQEICDNGVDDDGDGLIDCFDPDCQTSNNGCVDFYFGADTPECRLVPDPLLFSMEEQYRSANNHGHDYIVPAVGDLDGDGNPEIVTISPNDKNRKLYVLNGLDGTEIASITYEGIYHSFAGGPTIVDVDKDGTAEIFMVTGNSIPNGQQHWAAKQWVSRFEFDGGALTQTYRAPFGKFGGGWGGTVANRVSAWDGQKWATPQFVDFNADGTPEMFIGNQVFDVATGAIIAGPPNDNARKNWPRGKQGAGDLQDYMPAAYDILPDGFCANCSGVELVCGNTIYAVDLSDPNNAYNGISIEAQMTPTGTYGDGFTSLADWDGDGEMDVIVVAEDATNGAYVYIWNPRTRTIIQGPKDIRGGNHPAGRATIADFDGDGVNELSIVSKDQLNLFESNLTKKWTNVTSDGSAKTSATAFDFEGDGNMEVVYRDETTLFILDGVTGDPKATFPCGSGTRVDMPVIVDVDADGEAEIVCSCIDRQGLGNNDPRHTVVFKSSLTPWVSTRKVWNSFHYSPTFINDDLTIPLVRQNKALIDGLDIYGAQTPILNKLGEPVFPGLPDVISSADSIVLGDCADDSATVYVSICEEDNLENIWGYPISYYEDDPLTGGSLIKTITVDSTLSNVSILNDSCVQVFFKVENDNYNLYVVANDDGTDPLNAPSTATLECDSSNNMTLIPVGCRIVNYDTVTICLGDTAVLEASDTSGLAWATTENYDVANDSVINAIPLLTSHYIANSINYTDSIYVIVNPLPIVSLRNDTSICEGNGPLTLDAENPTATFDWNVDSTTQTISVDKTGEYIVIVTNEFNCVGTDTMDLVVHPCNIDLGVTKTDGREDYTPGTTTEYTIVVTNYGPYDAVDVTINDPAPVGIAAGDISWDATAYGGATSGVTGSQSGILNDLVSIPVGDSIVYSVNIAVPGNYKGDLINVVTISHPLDTNSSNDTAEDIDFNGLCVGSTVSSFAEQFNTGVKINPGENDPNWKIQWINDPAYYVYSANNYATPISDAVIPAVGMNKAAGVWADASYPDYLWVCYPWTGPNNGPGKHIDVDGDGNIQEYDGGRAIVGTGDAVLLKFSKTFEMTASQLEASEITFDIAADNHIMDIIVNGVSQGPKALSGYSLHPHAITQDFQLGSNTIEIVVNSGPGFAGMMIANSTIKAVDSVSLMITDPPLICAPNTADITDSLWTIGSINADSLVYFEDLTATQSLTNPTMVDSGTYTIVAINEVGCADTAQIYVGQNPIADVELMPDTAFCLGGEVTINAGVYDSIVWSTGDITSSITVDSTNEYKVVVYNEFKCSDSDSVTITVHDLPIVTVRDTTICPGGTGRFEAVSVTATDYLWQKEGEGTTQSITDSIVGFYEVIVTDVNGCKDTAEAELTLHTPPVVEVSNDTICVGDPEAVFNATSATAVNYIWLDNGHGTGVSTSGIDAGDYTVIVEDINTCKDTATGVLVVDTLPIVELQGAAICDNVTSVDLTAVSVTAVSYLWSGLGSGTTQTITASTQGNYVVTVTDENGCQSSDDADLQRYPMPTVTVDDQSVCQGGEATFTAVSATATVYDWRQNGTGTAQTTVGSTAGMYEVIVEDINGCKDTAEAELIIYIAPEVTVDDNRICIGDAPAIFEAKSATATSYSWSENGTGIDQTTTGTDAGNYTVIVTDINSCKDTATGVLVVDTLPVVSVQDVSVCSNTPSVDLTAISTTAQAYDWTGTVTGNTSILTVSEPGNYVVTVTDENGCQQSSNADLIHIQQPEDFEIEGELVACEGDEIELSINVTSQFKNWSTGEQGGGIVVDQNGTYSVTVANEANGIRCEASNSVDPIFLPYADQPNEPYIVNCFDHYQEIPVSFETNASIDWGDLTISRDNELLVTEPGIYSANIYLHEQCQITANLEVEEFCPYTVFVPNAFTPNGDGRNETFEPKVNNIIDYKLYIFNRWGDLIFTSNHEDNQWDGTYLGNPVQIDVYVYKLIVTGNKSMGVIEEQQFVGTVSVIR